MLRTNFISRLLLIAGTLVLAGCPFDSDCKTLSCAEILPSEVSEMKEIGVTIPLFTVRGLRYENTDGLPVINNYALYFPPAPGTEELIPQTDNSYGVDFDISQRNRLTLLDVDGNVLDQSTYPDCWDSAINIFRGNTMIARVEGIAPDGFNYILQANLNCVPAAADRLIHEYTRDNGTRERLLDRPLSDIRHWRSTVQPLICRNQTC